MSRGFVHIPRTFAAEPMRDARWIRPRRLAPLIKDARNRMRIPLFNDPACMPVTGESPDRVLELSEPLSGTAGAAYVERRGIPLDVADTAGVRFAPGFNGRPAVLVAMRDRRGVVVSVHGRYLHSARGENKMLTIGQGGGVVEVLDGRRAEPLVIVEGLFDALSLAVCGRPCIATIGRWAPWLPEIAAGRTVWLAFDAARPAESEVARYRERLREASVHRLLPPPRCKDWNTALTKRGAGTLGRWLRDTLGANNSTMT